MKTILFFKSRLLIKSILLLICSIVLVSCSLNTLKTANFNIQKQGARQYIPLSGDWKFKKGDLQAANLYEESVDDSQWSTIRVPANWYLEGHDINGVAWYKKHFNVPHSHKNKRFSLNFGGIDYSADIWLNGKYIGFHEGYFQPFTFDVTDTILLDQDNVLTVKVNSPLEAAGKDWSIHKRLIKGIFSHHDTRPGGAWSDRAQEKNTGGIWSTVDLEIHDVARINHVKVAPQINIEQKHATAMVEMSVDLQQKSTLSSHVKFTLKPYNFHSPDVVIKQDDFTLSPGENKVTIPIDIKNPKLWWPWDQGDANLYKLEVSLFSGDKAIDSTEVTFGFRNIQYDMDKKIWVINGKRMFLRGTNYIATQWLSEMSRQRFSRDVSLMKDANINAVRVHAHITDKEFYRQCDEAGMLVWQDFPLQWGYTDDLKFHDEAQKQAKEMVDILYNHPSIFAWSLMNEPVWDAPWMKFKYSSYNNKQNKQLTEKLYQTIYPYDKTRYVHAFSSTAEHPWAGWYFGSWLDFNKPTSVPIIAEFGAQALPEMASLRKIFSEQDLWPVNQQQWDKWDYHNFQQRETFKIAKVPMGRTPTEFVENTQTYQAKLVKLAAESYRRQRYTPVNSIFQFMFVEDWPSVNWGVVDYWRTPKLGYYALKQAYQPVLPSIAWVKENFKTNEKAEFTLWIINDLHKKFPKAQMSYSLRNKQKLLETNTLSLDIAEDSSQQVKTVAWSDLAAGKYELIVKIEDKNHQVLGINQHLFEIFPESTNLEE
ncbi:MAG: beta galactosidase jelly roll domain-containing protein [Methylococcales bacterium]|nr:beta galactosidase jelly roll domain-containing protein [Methylococcales bacterium]